MANVPLINGTAYSWADVTVNILNKQIAGITAVSYEDKQAMEDFYGAGNRPVLRGFGKIECTGSITLMNEELEVLMEAAPNGRIQEIEEFDVVIAYAPVNGTVRTHTLKNCRFKGNKRDIKVDDMKFEIQLELLVSHINWA